jgi:hypothetical protein
VPPLDSAPDASLVFLKSPLYILTLYNKYNRALTFPEIVPPLDSASDVSRLPRSPEPLCVCIYVFIFTVFIFTEGETDTRTHAHVVLLVIERLRFLVFQVTLHP